MDSAAPTTFPEAVEEALVNHDWRLRPSWNARLKRWEILQLKRGVTSHPQTLQPMPPIHIDRRYWMILAIERNGHAVSPGHWVVNMIQQMDFKDMSPKEIMYLKDQAMQSAERIRQKDFDDKIDAGSRELYPRMITGREQVGFGGGARVGGNSGYAGGGCRQTAKRLGAGAFRPRKKKATSRLIVPQG